MVYVLAVSVFGFVFGARMMEHLINRDLFSRNEMTKIGTTYLAIVIFLAVTLPRARFSIWIAVFLPMFVLSIALAALLRRRAVRFRDSFSEVLTMISLKLKAGFSFRQAFSEVCAETPADVRAKLTEIGSFVVFSQQNRALVGDRFVAEVIEELIRIDQQPHLAARRLAIFREKLRIEDDFRRRSGQVLARTRAQSLIMSGLYLALAAFMAWRFGFADNQKMFFLSGVLFAAGSIWMWRGGRTIRWRV